MKHQPNDEPVVSIRGKKRLPTYEHCSHKCPVRHKSWFHQICESAHAALDPSLASVRLRNNYVHCAHQKTQGLPLAEFP